MPACMLSRFGCGRLCDPMGHSLPGSSVHGILQARILQWLPCSPPGDLPNPGMEPALAIRFFTTSTTWKALNIHIPVYKVSKLPRF